MTKRSKKVGGSIHKKFGIELAKDLSGCKMEKSRLLPGVNLKAKMEFTPLDRCINFKQKKEEDNLSNGYFQGLFIGYQNRFDT